MRRLVTAAVAIITVVALSGGACGSVRRLPPAPSGPVGPAPDASAKPDFQVREATAPNAGGLPTDTVAFADADTGYALFQRREPNQPAQAALAVSRDGGGSWLSRPLPFDPARDNITFVRLRVGRGNVLILAGEPVGWWVSHDFGATFEKRPPTPAPIELNLAGSTPVAQCLGATQECTRRIAMEIDDNGAEHPFPTQPPFPPTSVAAGADGRLWAAAAPVDGVIRAALSRDHGKTWALTGTMAVNAATDDPELVASPDGADVWAFSRTYGFKATPDGQWSPAPVLNVLNRAHSAVALGGGLLVVAGPAGVLLISGPDRLAPGQAPTGAGSVRRIAPDVVEADARSTPGTVWLCTCQAQRQEWIEVRVSAAES